LKTFVINCDFGGQVSPFTIHVGSPEHKHHPLHFQSEWLTKERGGNIPPDIIESLSKLKDLAAKNNTSFEELCVYAIASAYKTAEEDEEGEEDDLEY
jgi:hypothetical protein